jgi:uncharacterized protein YrrD
MSVKGSRVVGLKILTLNEGKEVGQVKDILYSDHDHKVLGVLLKTAGVLSDGLIIRVEKIHSIGDDALIIENEEVIEKIASLPEEIANIATGDNFLTKAKIVTESGQELGKISDIHFDAISGQVEEMEVTGGVFETIESGKKRIKPENILTIGPDAIIVQNFVEANLEEQSHSSGIRGAVSTTSAKIRQTGSQLKTKIEAAKNNPENREMLQEVREKGAKIREDVRAGWESIEAKTAAVEKNIEGSIRHASDRREKKFTPHEEKEAKIPQGSTIEYPKGTRYVTKEELTIKD